MKKMLFALAVLLIVSSAAAGEPPGLKKFEFSAALSFQNIRNDTDEQSAGLWNIPVRVGYFLTKWLEVEPEIMLTKTDYYQTIPEPWSYLASLNIAANFLRPNRVIPFILAGAGFGNGFPLMGSVSGASHMDSFAVNLGGGLKFFIIPSAALRLEYRFSHYRMSYALFNETSTANADLHQVLIGVSLVF
jgi:opacity protein-like surface antigen